MLLKIYQSYRDVVAICDKDLLGKKFKEGIYQLEVKENFYNGKEVSQKELIEIIESLSKEDATFNIVGDKSVNCAIKAGIIDRDQIKKIGGIPFALVLF